MVSFCTSFLASGKVGCVCLCVHVEGGRDDWKVIMLCIAISLKAWKAWISCEGNIAKQVPLCLTDNAPRTWGYWSCIKLNRADIYNTARRGNASQVTAVCPIAERFLTSKSTNIKRNVCLSEPKPKLIFFSPTYLFCVNFYMIIGVVLFHPF